MANYSFVVGDYKYTALSSTILEVHVQANDKTKTSYENVPSSVSYGGKTFTVKYLGTLFMEDEELPGCFEGCTNLITAPVVPAGTDGAWWKTFANCSSLIVPPTIPSGVRSVQECFYGCTSLNGNITVKNIPTARYNVFGNTTNDIYIINKGFGENTWKFIASQYTNVHYEADDNPQPVLSNFSALRVQAVGATTFDATGLYAYIQARLMRYVEYLPVGWTNEIASVELKDNGSVETPTWEPEITEYPADEHCWISLGDTSKHTITLQITEAIKDDSGTVIRTQSSELLSVVISKSYALVDYYHDETSDTEGIAFGKYAEHADLFDVDMPARFRQYVDIDGNVSANNALLELDTTATSGTDKEIYDALVSLGWDSDVIV